MFDPPTAFSFRSYAALTAQPNALNTSAVGYSGVLFTYALIEAFHSAEVSRSVFGLFSVPTKAYPFILLVLIQVGNQAIPYKRISTWCLVFTEYLVFSPGADAEHLVVGAPIGAAGGGAAHLPPGRGCPRAHSWYCLHVSSVVCNRLLSFFAPLPTEPRLSGLHRGQSLLEGGGGGPQRIRACARESAGAPQPGLCRWSWLWGLLECIASRRTAVRCLCWPGFVAAVASARCRPPHYR